MRRLLVSAVIGAVACGPGVEDGEWLPGGRTTNTVFSGNNAFLMPAANLSPEDELDFYSGNSFFNQAWVEAPASTDARDGLGPLFNARSCSGCHLHDGRGAPPEDGQGPFVGVLLRLSVPGVDGPVPDPVYGGQLQDRALPGHRPEAIPRFTVDRFEGTYADGTPYTLHEPIYHLDEPGYGPFSEDLQVSPRVAPQMIGLGLLEAIAEADLEALADPDDADGDGISGRIQRGSGGVGRFGWKGDARTIREQVAGAFAGDMGLTTPDSVDDCTEAQVDCLQAEDGGDPEVSETILGKVVLYSQVVAVPARRAADDREVLRGKAHFHDLGCASCHVPDYQTGPSEVSALSDQHIWPYTDLLLHDMGEGLADHRPLGDASGSEWQTPPLWGLGLIDEVSGHTRFLHDGRAHSLEEAILWHGGEAEAARDAFIELSAEERQQVLRFLEDL